MYKTASQTNTQDDEKNLEPNAATDILATVYKHLPQVTPERATEVSTYLLKLQEQPSKDLIQEINDLLDATTCTAEIRKSLQSKFDLMSLQPDNYPALLGELNKALAIYKRSSWLQLYRINVYISMNKPSDLILSAFQKIRTLVMMEYHTSPDPELRIDYYRTQREFLFYSRQGIEAVHAHMQYLKLLPLSAMQEANQAFVKRIRELGKSVKEASQLETLNQMLKLIGEEPSIKPPETIRMMLRVKASDSTDPQEVFSKIIKRVFDTRADIRGFAENVKSLNNKKLNKWAIKLNKLCLSCENESNLLTAAFPRPDKTEFNERALSLNTAIETLCAEFSSAETELQNYCANKMRKELERDEEKQAKKAPKPSPVHSGTKGKKSKASTSSVSSTQATLAALQIKPASKALSPEELAAKAKEEEELEEKRRAQLKLEYDAIVAEEQRREEAKQAEQAKKVEKARLAEMKKSEKEKVAASSAPIKEKEQNKTHIPKPPVSIETPAQANERARQKREEALRANASSASSQSSVNYEELYKQERDWRTFYQIENDMLKKTKVAPLPVYYPAPLHPVYFQQNAAMFFNPAHATTMVNHPQPLIQEQNHNQGKVPRRGHG